jgi:hypothetical protein
LGYLAGLFDGERWTRLSDRRHKRIPGLRWVRISLRLLGLAIDRTDSMSCLSRPERPNRLRAAAAALLACASVLVSGCSGSMIADHLPAAVGGLPEDAPARPATPAAYPAVHNMPPARSTKPLDDAQQKQLEDDLVAARNRYGGNPDAAGTTGTTADPKAGAARNP